MSDVQIVKLRNSLKIFAIAALVLSAGCSNGDKDDDRYQSARQVCGGISEQSAKALESVAATKKFTSTLSTRKFELPTTLPDEFDGKIEPKRHLLCRIEPQNVVNDQSIGITFEVVPKAPPPPNKKLRGNSHYKAGLRADASDLGATIWFKCASDGTGEDKAAIIKTDYAYWPPRGLISQEGNMRLVNEMSYRLAEQLSCLRSSGLTRGMPPEE
jgi:hypothetical protein